MVSMEVLITGSAGQDGTYLRQLLQAEGASVTGIDRSFTVRDSAFDPSNPRQVDEIVSAKPFDEVYYLAAHQSSSEKSASADQFELNFSVNHRGPVNFLNSIHSLSPSTKFFYAASAHVFGRSDGRPLGEDAPKAPICLYGKTKLLTLETIAAYRTKRRLFACSGILFNHESALRKRTFLSRKVIEAALEIRAGRKDKLLVGNLEQLVDWGYAPDYVRAFPAMLRRSCAEDFVVSSGELHTVREFVETVFRFLGLDYHEFVAEDSSLLPNLGRGVLYGDNRKLLQETLWRPRYNFRTWIELMVQDLAEQKENK